MVTILAYSIKPIITSLSNSDDIRELLTIMKNLFYKVRLRIWLSSLLMTWNK